MKAIYGLIIMSPFFLSCEKTEETQTQQVKRLDRVHETTPGVGYSGMNYFKYDADGNLSRITHRNLAAGATDSFYIQYGRSGGRITGIDLGLRLDPVPMTFFFAHVPATGQIDYFIKRHRERRDSFKVFTTPSLITVEGYYGDTTTSQVTKGGTTKYVLTDGNLTDVKIYNPQAALISHEVMSYDSKKSPFKGSMEETLLLFNRFGYFSISAPRNLTTENTTSSTGSVSEKTITYMYDTDGLPAMATLHQNNPNFSRQFEFFYK